MWNPCRDLAAGPARNLCNCGIRTAMANRVIASHTARQEGSVDLPDQVSRGMKPGLPVLTTVLNLCLVSI